jgi:membrane-associated two-gene conflict system component 1 (EACC1)
MMDLVLEPSSERFDVLDDPWLRQVAVLIADLRREIGDVHQAQEPRPGTKGVELGSIVVTLASASAFGAVAQVVKAFIERDRGRSIRVAWHESGMSREVEIRGSNLDEAARLIANLDPSSASAD